MKRKRTPMPEPLADALFGIGVLAACLIFGILVGWLIVTFILHY